MQCNSKTSFFSAGEMIKEFSVVSEKGKIHSILYVYSLTFCISFPGETFPKYSMEIVRWGFLGVASYRVANSESFSSTKLYVQRYKRVSFYLHEIVTSCNWTLRLFRVFLWLSLFSWAWSTPSNCDFLRFTQLLFTSERGGEGFLSIFLYSLLSKKKLFSTIN